ncbi:MAG: YidB family protein [Gammaproteobacteria bacterium]|nr:YidB family protein [Gammaproteobacteria bacterium]
MCINSLLNSGDNKMDFKSLATKVLMEKIGSAKNSGTAESALDALVGGNKGFDLGSVVGQFTGGGGDLAKKAASWLGDGSNDAISPSQLQDAIGGDKIDAFASKLGIDREEASNSLSQILPELIDKSSQGGSLLGSIGGRAGLAGLASKFFRR